MVIDRPHDGQTVFAVFATRARRRSRPSLVGQAAACAIAGLLLVVVDLALWPVTAALAAGTCYAVWALIDRQARSRLTNSALRALAAAATILAVVSVVGIGLAAFTGDGQSPYGMCYDVSGRAFACDAQGQRRPLPK